MDLPPLLLIAGEITLFLLLLLLHLFGFHHFLFSFRVVWTEADASEPILSCYFTGDFWILMDGSLQAFPFSVTDVKFKTF